MLLLLEIVNKEKGNLKFPTRLITSLLLKSLEILAIALIKTTKDTAGQERFHSLGPIYYRDSDGALLVYDITDQFSFEKVKQWVKELRRMLGSSVQLCIVGNKIDLQRFRNVTLVDAQRFADEVGASHCLTSAKTNEGIEQAFLSLCERMIAYRRATLNEPENRMNDGVDSISFYGQEKSRGRRGCC
ncbi:Ras family protein [Trichuris suis]|nr:Ras family protein [Trichuris suis]